MPMTGASMFWLDTLHNCHLDRSISLPYDRYRLSNEHRSGCGTSVSFDFDQVLSHQFLVHVASNNITIEQLTLACYYVFLFKLTNGEKDLCIGMNVDNRYKDDFKSMIGLFQNIIPLRCQLDPHWSFCQLVEHVQEMITSSLEYSYFPLQRILAGHPNSAKPTFLDISFEFRSDKIENKKNEVIIGDVRLCTKSLPLEPNEDEIMSKFDFAFIFQHDLKTNQLSCTINASRDLFYESTINMIGHRFHVMLNQLFQTNLDQINRPIHELSLILPDERLIMQSLNNTQVILPSVTCVHHEFAYQVMKYPQKLAVELDDQSLTYAELLHYAQMLSLNLLNAHRVVSEEIVCQCVERSLSMVS
jgi:non-ribosomal peptide synthetase component F